MNTLGQELLFLGIYAVYLPSNSPVSNEKGIDHVINWVLCLKTVQNYFFQTLGSLHRFLNCDIM